MKINELSSRDYVIGGKVTGTLKMTKILFWPENWKRAVADGERNNSPPRKMGPKGPL